MQFCLFDNLMGNDLSRMDSENSNRETSLEESVEVLDNPQLEPERPWKNFEGGIVGYLNERSLKRSIARLEEDKSRLQDKLDKEKEKGRKLQRKLIHAKIKYKSKITHSHTLVRKSFNNTKYWKDQHDKLKVENERLKYNIQVLENGRE